MAEPTQPTLVEQAQEAATKLATNVAESLHISSDTTTAQTDPSQCLYHDSVS